MQFFKFSFIRLLCISVFFSVSGAALAAPIAEVAEAKSLITSGSYQKAFELLESLEPKYAGDVDYDYMLGVAAIESGNVTRGVFALERVLATDPNHAKARTHIAKGYFLLGEADTAKAEYESLLKSDPDQTTKTAIERYMSAIDKSLGLSTSFSAYLDFGLGHDTNVNSGTDSSTIAIPFFGGLIFNLNDAAQETSDNFKNLSGGVSVSKPINKNFSVIAGANISKRMNWQDEEFDNTSYNLNVGGLYKQGKNAFTLALKNGSYYINQDRFRNTYGFVGQWQHNFDKENQLTVFGQGSRITFKGNKVRDANRYIVGAGYAHAFAGDKSPVIFASLYGGKEDTRDNDFDYLSQDIYGLRLGGQLAIKPHLVTFGSFSYENRDNDSDDPLFRKTRDDDQYTMNLGVRYIPRTNWLITPQISHIKNDSNIKLFEFDRTVLSVNFRHSFNW